MRALFKLTLVEAKLFIREPVTVFFTFALPVLFLFVMGGVFGNVSGDEFDGFRNLPAMDFYTPAYIGLVITAVSVVSLPGHLTGYRERGVLHRFRASSFSVWRVFGAQGLVSMAIAVLGSCLILIAALLAFGVNLPQDPLLVLAAFLISALSFISFGLLLGAILPTSRAAQGIGLILFFVMLILGGAGPPQEVMTRAMQTAGDFTPLRHSVTLLQNAWLGLGWSWTDAVIMIGILLISLVIALMIFRRDA